MTVGDTVTIRDYSWVTSVVSGELRRGAPNRHDGVRQYTVVEVDCSFPLVDYIQPDRHRNNTVIQDEGGKVVFIHSKFLDFVDPPHVWKHGDVFVSKFPSGYNATMILLNFTSGDKVFNLNGSFIDGPATNIDEHLECATFLFNIKDKLNFRG